MSKREILKLLVGALAWFRFRSTWGQQKPSPSESGFAKLSPATQQDILRWVDFLKQETRARPSKWSGGQWSGPNPDPDYSEFWVELHPAPPENSAGKPRPPSFGLVQGLNLQQIALISGGALNDDPARHDVKGRDVLRELRKLTTNPKFLAADFGEDAWCEITPYWAEMYPPVNDLATKPKKGKLTVRALKRGKPVSPDYFAKLLDEVNAYTPPNQNPYFSR